jgi:hypothetical protein
LGAKRCSLFAIAIALVSRDEATTNESSFTTPVSVPECVRLLRVMSRSICCPAGTVSVMVCGSSPV